MSLELLRVEGTGTSKHRYRYNLQGNPLAYCYKLFQLRACRMDRVSVLVRGDKAGLPVVSYYGVERLAKMEPVSLCDFKGDYKGNPLDVCVDFDLSMLTIVSSSEPFVKSLVSTLSREWEV